MYVLMKKLIIFFITIFFAVSFVPAFAAGGKIEFRALDVGQGDSLLLRLPGGESVLIDAGTRDAGKVVVENLKSLGIKKIDLFIATHPHEDHIGGGLQVLNSFPVGKVWDSGYNIGTDVQKRFLQAIKTKKIKFGTPKAGFSEMIGNVKFDVLAPQQGAKTKKNDANNSSLIVRVSWKEVSFLLMGDAEEEEQKSAGKFPQTTVLKLSHHGSRGETNLSLLNSVKPQISVVSHAAKNSYGHPHKETLKLLQDKKIPLYSTVNGNVIVESDGKDISVRNEKFDGSILDMFIKWFMDWWN